MPQAQASRIPGLPHRQVYFLDFAQKRAFLEEATQGVAEVLTEHKSKVLLG
jgi:hypothetical protein